MTSPMSETYDWICIGSGTSGLAAAVFGHDRGMKTLVLEKDDLVGGTTAQGAGLLYVPMNHLQAAAGVRDSRDEALKYLQYLGGPYADPRYQAAFLDNVAQVVAYLQEKAGVDFRISEMIDFWAPNSEGGWRHREDVDAGSKRTGRSLIPKPFPAETLGAWRDKARLDWFHHGLGEQLEGQEHNPSLGRLTKNATLGPHIGHSGPVRDADTMAMRLWRKRLGPDLDRYLNLDEEHRVGGAALIAYLLRAVVQRGVEVALGSRVTELMLDRSGRVVGVQVASGSGARPIQARRGVLIATGGGMGWRLAVGAGGMVKASPNLAALPGGFGVPDERGLQRMNYEARMRHSMIVNRFGQRFGDEVPYQGQTIGLMKFDSHGEHRWVNVPNFLVFDSQAIEKYSFAGRPPGETEGLEWLKRGNTVAELAEALGINAAGLVQSVQRFNAHVAAGSDPDFHRLPETLGPLSKGPFYGIQCDPPTFDPMDATISAIADLNGQVMHHETGEPIAGLYGAYTGGTLSQTRKKVFGYGYTAGLGQATSITFDWLAAAHAAAQP